MVGRHHRRIQPPLVPLHGIIFISLVIRGRRTCPYSWICIASTNGPRGPAWCGMWYAPSFTAIRAGTIHPYLLGLRVHAEHSSTSNTRRCVRQPHDRHARPRYGIKGSWFSMPCAIADAAYLALRYNGYIRRHGSRRVFDRYAVSRDSMRASAVCELLCPKVLISGTVIYAMIRMTTSPALLQNGP